MAALRAALRSAADGRGRLVALVGDVGAGKSRLVDELRAEAAELRVLRATGESYTSSTPYIAWRELLREMLDIGWEDPAEVVLDRLTSAITESDPSLLPWLPLIALTLDVSTPSTPEVEMLAEEFRRAKLHEAMLRFLDVQLSEPTLMEIEDVQYMDEASAALLTHVVEAVGERPWLIVVTRREEGGGFRASQSPEVLPIDVGPLTPEDAIALAEATTEHDPMPPHVIKTLAERSGGNPQFLRDLIRAVAETGSIDELPDSLESAAMARIDRLDVGDRAVLRRAAVLGLSFHPRMLTWLTLDDEPAPEVESLERLGGYFEDDGDGYLRFRHALVREAAYQGLPFRTRRRFHEAAGCALESETDEPDELSGLLSRHFSLAGDDVRAWRYSRVAAERARDAWAYEEAAGLYRRALDAAAGAAVDAMELADVWEAFGLAEEQVGEPHAAMQSYTAARRLVKGDRIREAELLYRHSGVDGRSGRIVPAVRWARRGLRTIEGIIEPRAVACRARLYTMLAGIRVRQGQYPEAIELARHSIRAAEMSGEQASLANSCLVIGWALTSQGDSGDEPYLRRALGIYEGLGDLEGQSRALNNLGTSAYWQGRWEDAVELWTRAVETSERAGDALGPAFGDCNIAEVLSDQGRFDEAEARLRRALQVWRGTNDEQGIAYASAQLGRTCVRSGRIDEGLELLQDALARYRTLHVEGDALDAEVWIAEGEIARGDPAGERTIARLAAQVEEGSPAQRSLERLAAYALAQRGDVDAARDQLTTAAQHAREAESPYDLALTLDALVKLEETDEVALKEMSSERESILGSLGVVRLPEPPLRGRSG